MLLIHKTAYYHTKDLRNYTFINSRVYPYYYIKSYLDMLSNNGTSHKLKNL